MNNLIVLVGYVCLEPKKLETASSTEKTTLRVVCYSGFKDQENLFIDVHLWGTTAEKAFELLHKGSHVLIQGELRQYTKTKDDGKKFVYYSVNGNSFQLLDKKEKKEESEPVIDEDDLPF